MPLPEDLWKVAMLAYGYADHRELTDREQIDWFTEFLRHAGPPMPVFFEDTILLLVTGDRDWYDEEVVEVHLKVIAKRFEGRKIKLVHGGARGADTTAHNVAKRLGWPEPLRAPADWDKLHKAAGPKRNQWMLDFLLANEANEKLALAFHDDLWKRSKGTRDMVDRLRKAEVETWHISHNRIDQVMG